MFGRPVSFLLSLLLVAGSVGAAAQRAGIASDAGTDVGGASAARPRQDVEAALQWAFLQPPLSGLLCYEVAWANGITARGCAGAGAEYSWVNVDYLYRPPWLVAGPWRLTGGGGFQLVWAQNFAGTWTDDALLGPGVVASVELTRVGVGDPVGFGVQLDGGAAFNIATTRQTLDEVIAPFARFSISLAIP